MTKQNLKYLLKGSSSYSIHFSLMACIKLDLFKILTKNNYTLEELSDYLNVNKIGLRKLINILKQFNILYEKNQKLFLAGYITNETVESIKFWLETSSDFINLWNNVSEIIKKDYKKNTNRQFWEHIYSNKESLLKYAKAFEWISKYTAQRLLELLPLNKEKVLDIGCGTGILLLEYIGKTNAIGIGVDFKKVEPLFKENITKYHLDDQVKFLSQDFLNLSLNKK